ncbi:non-ribosomal peptide synthetase, partial [Streptomyces clavuligerus]
TPPCRSGGGPGGEAVACIWHTSGTTGTPKPVAVPHQAVAARARALPAWTGITHSDRIAQITSTGFDAVLWEVLGALTTGARLQTAGPADRIAGPALAGFLARHKITALTCTPSTLSATPFTELPALRRIVLGGEALHPRPLAAWIARYDVANAYGPTEACVEALVSDHITPGHDHPVPIGRPLPGVHAWILDHRHRPVAPGQAGELYLGGDGLATGYPGHPEETAAAFLHLDLPTPAGMRRERVYRTGDRARQTAPGGEFVYLGRCDHQLNPGGVRLEPLEVETTATTLPGVRAAALLVQHGRLVLHAEADDDPGLAGRLRAHLADRLPPPAVPAVIVRHDRLPRTASGKTDRHALTLIPAPTAPVPQTGAPTAGLAGEAAQWWQELTGTPPGGRDFFADGGTSLAALVLIQRVNEHHGTQIVIGAFTADPTPGFLARTLNPEGDCS